MYDTISLWEGDWLEEDMQVEGRLHQMSFLKVDSIAKRNQQQLTITGAQ